MEKNWLLRILGGSRHVSVCMAHNHPSPTGHLAYRRRTRADHPPDRFHTSGTPLPWVRWSGTACPSSFHQDAGRSPMEWRWDHLAAPRPQDGLPQRPLPMPPFHRATARDRRALGPADMAADGTPPRHRPSPGWGCGGAAEPAMRVYRQSDHAMTRDPPHPLPRDRLPTGPQRGRLRAAEAPHLRHALAGSRTAAAPGPAPRPGGRYRGAVAAGASWG
jgi:hypothetical protein